MRSLFHFAFNVTDLDEARRFYGGVLGCPEGRSTDTWVDFDFFDHQISLHLGEPFATARTGEVGGQRVPMPHFGLVLALPEWRAMATRLQAAGTAFILEPQVRYQGEPGEQWTMFFCDSFGNPLEIKGLASLDGLYARRAGAPLRTAAPRMGCAAGALPQRLLGLQVMNFSDLIQPSSALFLDFDGTLVDIAPQPEAVVVPPGLVQILAGLQQMLGGALAVVSGRPIQQIDAFLAPLQLPVAGEHGAERRDSAGQTTLLPALPLQRVEDAAQALAREYPALRVETKRGSVAVHFRQAPELEALCVSTLQAAVDDSPGLALLAGKMVAEAKPGNIGKGKAIEAFLLEPPFKGRVPLFVGDDVTDEAGFAVVQARGGMGFKVGEGSTLAWHRLPGPAMLCRDLENALARHAVRGAA